MNERSRDREAGSENERKLMNYGNPLGTLYFLVMETHQSLWGASVGLHWVYQIAVFPEHLLCARLF